MSFDQYTIYDQAKILDIFEFASPWAQVAKYIVLTLHIHSKVTFLKVQIAKSFHLISLLSKSLLISRLRRTIERKHQFQRQALTSLLKPERSQNTAWELALQAWSLLVT